ncbi:MAG: hypothetical protein RLZZ381_2854 [Cyanobacteriota bacterium]
MIPVEVVAQVTPDGSVPTTVEEIEEIMRIEGGKREGNNLFHSFEEFSIPEGMEAVFENALDIENIFARITGESASAINGILSSQGSANFFLINPKGIIFGENASLDVGGSFIATTANSVQFEDGTEFVADDAESEPILTVSVPIGLQFEGNNGAIAVNGDGLGRRQPPNYENTTGGLRVQPDETLALVGSELQLQGATLATSGGQIELGSVGASGVVNLTSVDKGWTFGYDNIPSFSDVSISDASAVDVSGTYGNVNLQSRNLTLQSGSQIQGGTSGAGAGGTVAINANEAVNIIGVPGAELGTNTQTQISTEAQKTATGSAGNIKIDTERLTLTDEAQIAAGTIGTGGAGDIDILASDSVEIIGKSSVTDNAPNNPFGSAISSIVDNPEATGNSGDITIETGRLALTDGGGIAVSTYGQLSAGNISIKARDSVEITGKVPNASSSFEIPTLSLSRISAFTAGEGNGGNVSIEARQLSVSNDAKLVVSSDQVGNGNAGTLFINADSVNLNNSGSITAETASGTGGNINLNTDSLQIDEGSQITAEAGNNGDGGNITINTNTLIAKKNSEVTANAFNGTGGNLEINAEGLFLFDSLSNIFSASSELGIDGTIKINAPDLDLQKELEQSELKILTTEEAIASSCLARSNQQGSFTVNNSPGAPKSPDSNYSDTDFTLTGISSLPTTAKQPEAIESNYQPSNTSMLPASKMVETPDGRIFLVAAPQEPESLVCPQN